MFLIVGLGNPGKAYEKTRHNVGFMALDTFQKEHGFPGFSPSKKHSSLVSEGILGSAKAVLAKPQTFMNNSGRAVKSLLGKTKPGLVVVHDDIDIPLGKVKISRGSGSAGHKGVESIIQALGTKNFTRVRVGIQPATGKSKNVETFVLKNFTSKERLMLQQTLAQALTQIIAIARN